MRGDSWFSLVSFEATFYFTCHICFVCLIHLLVWNERPLLERVMKTRSSGAVYNATVPVTIERSVGTGKTEVGSWPSIVLLVWIYGCNGLKCISSISGYLPLVSKAGSWGFYWKGGGWSCTYRCIVRLRHYLCTILCRYDLKRNQKDKNGYRKKSGKNRIPRNETILEKFDALHKSR